ncbi:hypothetical protein C8A03DRAFT_45743 [Achaetomium macrosporum]|uniref:Altered inheritance of mitochondria protein 32 n=1 Tax=Achaetomium macrosporum TaxID=79813 RepID=A0AAN7C6C3_9PEZI|nr:hypothetical protein C8A03DRAFT_45743 [Achaetomium macrosporum]
MTIHRLLARACTRSPSVTPRMGRAFATKTTPPPSFPTIPTCPAPTCACAPTPELPKSFEIDHKASLNGLISNYAQHVLVCTGKDDWPSRIEEDNGGDNLAADLRELVGPRGKFNDPFHNISILNSSLPSSPPPKQRPELQTSSVYILPQFKYVPYLPRVSFDSAEALVRGYLQPDKLHPMHDGLSPIHRDRLLRKPAYQNLLWGVRDVREVVVLICGHGGRDQRCGIFGPLLRDEFEKTLPRRGIEVLKGPVEVEGGEGLAVAGSVEATWTGYAARVGLISHIGGHKFAGNVIVYLPPGLRAEDGKAHPLAGHGIWYGRVEPRHVEGVLKIRTQVKIPQTENRNQNETNHAQAQTPPVNPKPKRRKPWLEAAIVIGLLCAFPPTFLTLSSEGTDNRVTLNPDTFVPFTITSREQVSPTAFILTVEPPPREKGGEKNDEVIAAAWRHGLWSVEVKQPQLQVARDYTPLPLPPSPRQEQEGEVKGDGDGDGKLRFYIRRMDGGEVSGYLSRLQVGDTMELRGPHLGFDVSANALLDRLPGVEMEVVWANRRREDCVGCGEGGGKQGAIVALLEDFRWRYGDRFRYSCTVDEEGSVIDAGTILRSIQVSTSAGPGSSPSWRFWSRTSPDISAGSPPAMSANSNACTYHSPKNLVTSDDRDPPAGTGTEQCQCRDGDGNRIAGGKNLLMVSGPEGFIAHYAGAKVWGARKELQGPVKGVISQLKRTYPTLGEDWLVLKM